MQWNVSVLHYYLPSTTLHIEPSQHRYEPTTNKANTMACAPSEDPDQPGHPPSLIRVFAVRLKTARILIYPLSAQRRLWSDWADASAQSDQSLRCAHIPFCWFCHDAAHITLPGVWSPPVWSLQGAGKHINRMGISWYPTSQTMTIKMGMVEIQHLYWTPHAFPKWKYWWLKISALASSNLLFYK